jgi:hypothetical protein
MEAVNKMVSFRDIKSTLRTCTQKIGKYVGFIGGDYGLDPSGDIQAMNTVLINHHNRGGIVTISWHFYNPWTGGDVWDTHKKENLWEPKNLSTLLIAIVTFCGNG